MNILVSIKQVPDMESKFKIDSDGKWYDVRDLASRPVVDSEWVEHNRQVGTTGQSVSPKLYLACGISGTVQHLAGMKKSEFIVAVNTDKDAPIGEIADVLVVVDLKEFVPALIEKLEAL